MEAAGTKARYEDLYNIPENMTGEILNGELYATPRPSRRHVYSASRLGAIIGSPYGVNGNGGPGGWVILIEPEIGLGDNILVPDLAGWRSERFPVNESTNWISVSPDWVCEVLSPGTARRDRITKMNIYALHGVPYLWLIDPMEKTLEAFALEAGRWVKLAGYEDRDKVRIEPFQETVIDLSGLWLGT